MSFFNWLKPAIDRGVKAGVDKAFAEFSAPGGGLDKIIREELAKPEYAWFRFVKHMQGRLREADPSLGGKESLDLARKAYFAFLKDEKIEFGDSRYDWSRDGARDLAEAYEVDHWDGQQGDLG